MLKSEIGFRLSFFPTITDPLREYDEKGTLRREVTETFGPGKPREQKDRVVREFDAEGFLFRIETGEPGEPKRVETFEKIWEDG